MMTEFNPANLKQGAGLLGASEKLRKGSAGQEPGQLMPFACMMGQACHKTTQKTGEILLNFCPDKGKMSEVRSQGSEMVNAPGLLKLNLKNAVAVKSKGIAESSHGAILKGEATKDINPFMNASKGKGTKTSRSFSGKINLLSKRDVQKQTGEKVKNLQVSSGLKKSEAGINHVSTGDARGLPKPGLNKQSIESGLTKSGLIKAVIEKNEAVKGSGSDTVGQNFRTGKIAVTVSKEGGFRESGAGINNTLLRGQRSEGRWQMAKMAKMEDAPGLLKFSLKKAAAAAKENSAKEPGRTEKNSFILAKNDGSGNDIKNPLKHQGLKSIEVAIEHERTGIEKFSDHKMEVLPRAISSPLHSVDKISSAGAYHHTSLHSGGGSAVMNESVNSHGIEPRALINQIASGVKSSSRVRITLNPPSLGTLDVDVLVRDNKVHVILQTENNDVRHILQSNVEQLKSSLHSQGLIVDNILVSLQEKPDNAGSQSGQNGTLFKEGRKDGEDEGNQRGLAEVSSSLSMDESNMEIEGHISLFA